MEVAQSKLLNKNLFLRIVSGVIMASIATFCITKNSFTFSLFILVIAIISYLEWFTIATNKLINQEFDNYKKYIMFWGVLGLIAILPSSASILYLRYIDGIHSIVYLILVVASTDIGAFFFGKMIGGPKLAPSISPGKTISGAFFGVISALSVATALFFIKYFAISYQKLLIITAILSVSSQIGDLLESAFKRNFGVKDSGKLIPGHGGFLDRIDGFLISAPILMIVYFLDLMK